MKRTLPNFKIGITFSGRYRKDYVEPFCNALLDLGYREIDIFYDDWHRYIINGINGDDVLREIYYGHCELIVVLLSPDYKEKHWCGNVEWRAIKELINTGNGDKICLLRVDGVNIGEIEGLYQTQSIAESIDNRSPSDTAKFIDQVYHQNFRSSSSRSYQRPPFIPHSLEGVLVEDAWKDHIVNVIEKVSYFIEWHGSIEVKTIDGQTWCRGYYYRGELLLKMVFTSDGEKTQMQIWDSCRNGTEQSGRRVFSVDNLKGYVVIHEYIPGDWDKRIFSWEAENSPLPGVKNYEDKNL